MAISAPPALLIVNPHALHNRLPLARHTDAIVTALAAAGIQAQLCQESNLASVRRSVRQAVRAGCPLIVAAGGDGTIEAIAPELLNRPTVLGLIPLGTYNNLAACLNIPTDIGAACEIIANGEPHGIDVGQVRTAGARRPGYFLEQATLGLGPLLVPVGEGLQKGHWLEALRALPAAARMSPEPVHIRLDDGRVEWHAETLLITICNSPRSAAGFTMAPEARLDDGELDVCVYDGVHQAELAAMVLEFMSGGVTDHPGVRRARATRVEVVGEGGMPVSADSEVVGEIPAQFNVQPAALRVKVPARPGLRGALRD